MANIDVNRRWIRSVVVRSVRGSGKWSGQVVVGFC